MKLFAILYPIRQLFCFMQLIAVHVSLMNDRILADTDIPSTPGYVQQTVHTPTTCMAKQGRPLQYSSC